MIVLSHISSPVRVTFESGALAHHRTGLFWSRLVGQKELGGNLGQLVSGPRFLQSQAMLKVRIRLSISGLIYKEPRRVIQVCARVSWYRSGITLDIFLPMCAAVPVHFVVLLHTLFFYCAIERLVCLRGTLHTAHKEQTSCNRSSGRLIVPLLV